MQHQVLIFWGSLAMGEILIFIKVRIPGKMESDMFLPQHQHYYWTFKYTVNGVDSFFFFFFFFFNGSSEKLQCLEVWFFWYTSYFLTWQTMPKIWFNSFFKDLDQMFVLVLNKILGRGILMLMQISWAKLGYTQSAFLL